MLTYLIKKKQIQREKKKSERTVRDEIVCDETNLRKERKGRGRMTERNGTVKWRFVSDRRKKKDPS